MTLTSKQKAFYAFSALFTLALLLVGRDRITEMISGSSKNKVQVSTLLTEYSAIPIRIGDRRPATPQTFDKGVITGVTAHFSSPASPREVLAYYSQALPSLGWEPSSGEFGTESQKLKFCKSGVSLIIEASAENPGAKYYLGLVWTAFEHGSAYCPRDLSAMGTTSNRGSK